MIKVRVNKQNYRVYALDFETHNDEESIAKKETSIRLGSFIDDESKSDDESSYVYTVEELLDKWGTLVNPKRTNKNGHPIKNILIYIWNLSFERSFIVPVLFKRGYTCVDEMKDEDEYVFKDITTKSLSSVWTASIKMNKDGGIIKLIDMCKLFPGSLRSVAKSFNLPTQKGEIDYRLNRLHNYVVTDEEKKYCFDDTRIIIEIILIMKERHEDLFFKTISAGSWSMKKMLIKGYPKARYPYKEYRKEYPCLGEEESEFLRKGVEGGITYVVPRRQYKEIDEKILHIDAHQMHPTQMYTKRFPYGAGTYGTGKPKFDRRHIFACRVRVSFDDVKIHSVIKLIGFEFVEDFELVLWDFEIRNMYDCYVNLRVKYLDYYMYNTKPLPWKEYFADNYRDRLVAKKTLDYFMIFFCKLLNNSAYGKFLERAHNQFFKTIINDKGLIDSEVIDKDEQETNGAYTYLPIGSCVPAYSRVCLTRTALLFDYKDIVYFDTDSIFVIWNKNTKRIRESHIIDTTDFLGGRGLEDGGLISSSEFSCAKRYKYRDAEGNAVIKMAGINMDEKKKEAVNEYKKKYRLTDEDIKGISTETIMDTIFPLEEINIDQSKWLVKRAFKVKGGTIVDVQRKDIGIQKKYEHIYRENKGQS